MLSHLYEVAYLALQIRQECQALDGSLLDDAPPQELYACGLLHDCIKDTSADWEDIAAAAGPRVADWVARLSPTLRSGGEIELDLGTRVTTANSSGVVA